MNEKLSYILNHPLRVPVAVGVVSFVAGVGAGYIWGRRDKGVVVYEQTGQLEFDFDHEVPSLRDALGEIKAQSPELVDESLQPKTEVEGYIREKLEEKFVEKVLGGSDTELLMNNNDLDPEDEVVAHNVFAGDDDDWDYEEELKKRNPDIPYIIHKDEFWQNEMDFDQMTLTYYAGDDIMADQEDSPVYNYHDQTGPLEFGHGSGDPNVVHVRNERRRAEFEILYDPGLYSVEVLGLEIENNQRAKQAKDMRHARERKFRMSD